MKAVFQFLTKASAVYLMLFFLFLTMPMSAQDEEYEDEYYDDDEYYDEMDYFPDWAAIILAGYGDDGGLALGAGLRWTNFSAQISLSGFTNDLPLTTNYNRPQKLGSDTTFYTHLIFSFNLGYHYNFDKFTPYATIGYYVQSDSAYVSSLEGGDLYRVNDRTDSGLAFGLGINYAFSEKWGMGLGYHSRQGLLVNAMIRLDFNED